MMLSVETNPAVIGRLRIRSKSPDPQAERQRVAQILRSANLHPSGLPPSATLVVRQLAGTLPLRLRKTRFGEEPDPSWQPAMTAEMDQLLSRAVRPALQTVPTGAISVLFLDRAELLATLALDWLSGTLALNWWWRELFRNADPVTTLLREWIRSPEFVPAALNLLSKRSYAVAFVRSLPPNICSDLLKATRRAHAVPNTGLAGWSEKRLSDRTLSNKRSGEEMLEAPSDGDSVSATARKRQHSTSVNVHNAGDSSLLRRQYQYQSTPDPWLPWVPEASASRLSTVQRVILAQALMLARAPTAARSTAFLNELLHWQISNELSDHHVAKDSDRQTAGSSGSGIVHNIDHQLTGSTYRRTAKGPDYHFAELSDHRKFQDSDDQISRSPDRQAAKGFDHPLAELSDHPIAKASGPQPALSRAEVITGSRGLSRPAVDHPIDLSPEAIETTFGGTFFLLNVALNLNIYADFSSPRGHNLELNLWDFLALLGSEFLGNEIETDPIWEVLAALAGRTQGQRPGESFDPPLEWRLPPQWLDAFPESYEPQTVLRDGRLVSIHPAGFPVLDVPSCAISEQPLVDPPEQRKRWLGWLTSYLHARLIRAMGRNDAAELLFRLSARVVFTHTHLDVTFSLNHHPFEVRYAGLDRDPGWIPAAGRYVAFHFD